jgi:NAD+ synthase (glutamine-hydrolysing)
MSDTSHPFFDMACHGFVRAAVAVPPLRVSDVDYNIDQTLALADKAHQQGCRLVAFPELGVTGYTCGDLFHQAALQQAVKTGLRRIVDRSRRLPVMMVVGAPLVNGDALYNCAVVIHRGRVLGVVPKAYLPNYREFYEPRQFRPAPAIGLQGEIAVAGQNAPFGRDLVFAASDVDGLVLGVEVCEDLWVPVPPSSLLAMAGARLIINLSASNITIGKSEQRRELALAQAARTASAYLYTAAGHGESTTDMAWDGDAFIVEQSDLLIEAQRFAEHDQLLVADIDLERLELERQRLGSFHDCAADYQPTLSQIRRVEYALRDQPRLTGRLRRPLSRFPFVPADDHKRDLRCFEAYNIQVQALAQRLQASGIDKLVIGVSGGLDSTHALLVAAATMDRLGLPRKNVLAWTLPGFATSEHTRENAWALMKALQVSAGEIDMRPSCEQVLKDIGHPVSEGAEHYDVAYENVQAGQRSAHLFRLANQHGALVLGTGDLSELALGWCTYGVGDQMSHYGINSSLPKTLIQHLIRWQIRHRPLEVATKKTLQAILDTEISPELVPGEASDGPSQSTEAKIGPYALQDFNLYYLSRYGYSPSKTAFLAWQAWHNADAGDWPSDLPEDERQAYDLPTIAKWLRVFIQRFYQFSQFKRSAMPDGPKVGSGGSLSPRGDWRAPSDARADVWLKELEQGLPPLD